MPELDRARIRHAFGLALEALLAERAPDGHWPGRLASSALSTATAVSALALMGDPDDGERIERGLDWLAAHQNSDGGWGDTEDSPSNLSTTMLARAAFRLGRAESSRQNGAAAWAERHIAYFAGAGPEEQTAALRAIYGKDRTFVVPILINCALAGQARWSGIPPLPFELALTPRPLLRALRLHVVSYALPALIAIGQLLHARRPMGNPLAWLCRKMAIRPTLKMLRDLQPSTGGFIEAVPLTSFVVMSLAAAGRRGHPVAVHGRRFLRECRRGDGSWPIDVDLAMWTTTNAMTALANAGAPAEARSAADWTLRHRMRRRHVFTDSAPGGWSWTDRDGGAPDADDTAGALLALAKVRPSAPREDIEEAIGWLLALQNRDGGWPTFCRGWSKLPFDRSAPDLTAHVLRALAAWPDHGDPKRKAKAQRRALGYLASVQCPDGAWIPLWFGNQAAPGKENPVFGTARVLRAYACPGRQGEDAPSRALRYMLSAQNADGGWGGAPGIASTVEETAVALDALNDWPGDRAAAEAAGRAAEHLARRILAGDLERPAPIGLYFSVLWYSERIYPMAWTVSALGRWLRQADEDKPSGA